MIPNWASALRQARILSGLTLAKAGRAAGVSEARLSRAERGLPHALLSEIEKARLRETYSAAMAAATHPTSTREDRREQA